ncbi:MAG: hypothetical protein V6Z86_05770 [Hyphomicrobiales bacterium]
MNYLELRTAITDYCEYDETSFTSNIPLFIRQAEQRIFFLAQLPFFRRNVTGNTTQGNRFLSLPTVLGTVKAIFSLAILDSNNEEQYLLNKDVNFLRAAYPGTGQGFPRYYALFDDDTAMLAPVPNGDYLCELHYSYEPASLTAGADDGTTWLSDNAEDAMLYGALIEAYTYMKGEAALLSEYKERFDIAIARLKNLGEGRDRKDTYRGGELRVQET